jgi:Xaa-Pro aminopeptidase
MRIINAMLLQFALCVSLARAAPSHMGIEAGEFQTRRQAVVRAASGGMILLHSFSAPKSWRDSGFQQDSNFYYLTGLENLHDAILALDGTTKESWLFVKPPTQREQRLFSGLTDLDSVFLVPDHRTEQALGFDHIVSWEEFSNVIEMRRRENPKIMLYVDQGGEGRMVADVSNPPGLAAIENPYLLWLTAIKAKWPDATIGDAAPILQDVRAIKSPAEIALMKRSAAVTDAGFRAAMVAIGPGRTNRTIEGAAIEAALRAGADGISMWPELKTGPVSGETVYQKFYDYHAVDRTVQRGETALIDLGFNYEFYKGDVGRTLPVSGHFTDDQREVIDFMNGAYHSGLRAMHDTVSANEVIETCTRYVEDHKHELHSELAKSAAVQLLKSTTWVMYTHGLDMIEIYPPKELHAGNTVAFGPEFYIDGQGFYEEDVVLITHEGHELINPPLPYSAADIEQMMARLKRSVSSDRR